MHPLIRDEYTFRRASRRSAVSSSATSTQVADVHGNELLQGAPTTDLLYSFGTLYPGALQLHNYPKFLQHFTRPDGKVVDLGSIDIMRMREFGVPRYTLFRDLLHLRPVRSFDDITDNPQWARQMRDVYEGRIDRVDLMVGMFAEPKPTGFRLQRHGVSHLHPDGLAPAEERSLLWQRLHARGLHARPAWTGSRTRP